MPWGTIQKPSVNPMTKLPPKETSALVRTSRWVALVSGVLYGVWRLRSLKPKQQEIHDREHLYFDFVKARIDKYWSDKSIRDIVEIKREVDGLPPLEFEPLDRPLLIDDEQK